MRKEKARYKRHGIEVVISRAECFCSRMIFKGWNPRISYIRHEPSAGYFVIRVGSLRDTALSMRIARRRAELMARQVFLQAIPMQKED